MTQQTSRSRVLRRVGVALAAAVAVSTVASTAGQAASKQSADKYGGDAKVATFDTLPGWCFRDNPANSALMVSRTIYETLFEKTIGGDMVGLLARDARRSSDLKTWTIRLRPNIKFHDGTAMDATAIKTNLDYLTAKAAADQALSEVPANLTKARVIIGALKQLGTDGERVLANLKADSASASANEQRVALLMALGIFADAGGLDQLISGSKTGGRLKSLGLNAELTTPFKLRAIGIGTSSAFLANIEKTDVVDSLTIRLTLSRPQNDVPGMLYASGRLVMRAPSQFTGAAALTCSQGSPIGTGPFKVESSYKYDKDSIKVVKNSDYWRTDPRTGDKLPYLDSITFTNVKEGSQRAAAVRRGTYDAGQFSAAADATFIKDLRKRRSLVTEFKSPVEYYPSLWLNQGKANSPFKSKNARLAVLHCIDRANYAKVRTKGEGTVARSLVGPKSTMYTTRGFHAFSRTLSKRYLDRWKAEDPAKNTELKFTIPADISGASQANAKFLIDTWKRCGITVSMVVEESAVIIGNAFNSGASSEADQNAYDAIAILLFEGTDVSFNLPFVLKNAYPTETDPAYTKYNSTSSAAIFASSVGSVLSLSKHGDMKVSKFFFDGQAAKTRAAAQRQYRAGTAYLQTEGYMGAITNFYYSMFVNRNSGLTNIGKVQIVRGKTQRIVTNWGIDWSGVQKKG